MWKIPEKYRLPSQFGDCGEPHGAFQVVSPDKQFTRRILMILASNGEGWEHVSVRADKNFDGKWKSFLPTWDEMCFVKSLFWDDEDVVMQLHPKKSEYVNNHPFVLHLWRPLNADIPTPPSFLVGIKKLNQEESNAA